MKSRRKPSSKGFALPFHKIKVVVLADFRNGGYGSLEYSSCNEARALLKVINKANPGRTPFKFTEFNSLKKQGVLLISSYNHEPIDVLRFLADLAKSDYQPICFFFCSKLVDLRGAEKFVNYDVNPKHMFFTSPRIASSNLVRKVNLIRKHKGLGPINWSLYH